jgi:hypothetical protein
MVIQIIDETTTQTVQIISTDPVVNVIIATVGDKGDKGDQGNPGIQGPPGNGVPVGGSTGQVLAKINGTDYNTQWVNQTGGGGNMLADATNANFTMQVNSTIYLPAATLSSNKTITIPAGASGNFMKLYNSEAGFAWLLAGASIYFSDGQIATQLWANTNYFIEFISGKWRILN